MLSNSIQLQIIIWPYNNINILLFYFTRVLCTGWARKIGNVEGTVTKLKNVFPCFIVEK